MHRPQRLNAAEVGHFADYPGQHKMSAMVQQANASDWVLSRCDRANIHSFRQPALQTGHEQSKLRYVLASRHTNSGRYPSPSCLVMALLLSKNAGGLQHGADAEENGIWRSYPPGQAFTFRSDSPQKSEATANLTHVAVRDPVLRGYAGVYFRVTVEVVRMAMWPPPHAPMSCVSHGNSHPMNCFASR